MATNRRGFLRRFGIGAAGATVAAVSGVTSAIAATREHEAAVRVVEKIVEVPVPVAGGLVWAGESFGYGTLELEAGEVFALTGLRNDLLLTSQGYARMIGKLGIVLCNCGRRFVFDDLGDQATENYILDHCTRTGHRPANLVGPADEIRTVGTRVEHVRVGNISKTTIRVDTLTDGGVLDEAEQLKLAACLREALDLPVLAAPDPVILEVGGTLRPSLRKDGRVGRRWFK